MALHEELIQLLLGFMSKGNASELSDNNLTAKLQEASAALDECR
jgi:hypothetical protein